MRRPAAHSVLQGHRLLCKFRHMAPAVLRRRRRYLISTRATVLDVTLDFLVELLGCHRQRVTASWLQLSRLLYFNTYTQRICLRMPAANCERCWVPESCVTLQWVDLPGHPLRRIHLFPPPTLIIRRIHLLPLPTLIISFLCLLNPPHPLPMPEHPPGRQPPLIYEEQPVQAGNDERRTHNCSLHSLPPVKRRFASLERTVFLGIASPCIRPPPAPRPVGRHPPRPRFRPPRPRPNGNSMGAHPTSPPPLATIWLQQIHPQESLPVLQTAPVAVVEAPEAVVLLALRSGTRPW